MTAAQTESTNTIAMRSCVNTGGRRVDQPTDSLINLGRDRRCRVVRTVASLVALPELRELVVARCVLCLSAVVDAIGNELRLCAGVRDARALAARADHACRLASCRCGGSGGGTSHGSGTFCTNCSASTSGSGGGGSGGGGGASGIDSWGGGGGGGGGAREQLWLRRD